MAPCKPLDETSPAAQSPGERGAAFSIHRDAADHVMRTGADRDQVAGDVQAETGTNLGYAWETLPHPGRIEMGEIEIDVGMLRAFHAADDGLGDDIAWSQLGACILGQHETDAVLVAQIRSLAADRFAD